MNSTAERFDNMSRRERFLIAITFMVLILVVFFLFAIEPLMKKEASLNGQLKSANAELKNKELELLTLAQALNSDPSKPLYDELDQLEKSEARTDQLLEEKTVNLVLPQEMSALLEKVMEKEQQVRLVKFTSLPVEVLQLSSTMTEGQQNTDQNETQATNDTQAVPLVYQHGFELVLQGNYRGVYRYLQHLESLSGVFFWDSLDYKVQEYPQAEVKLKLHTLSSDAGWIGG